MTNPEPTPLVSVIMNAYYSEEFLAEAIASVVAQTYSNWEIILWENESSDGTREIAESFNDPRIRYFFAPDKVSLYESRMNAFQQARGEFVAFLDCDDLWLQEKLILQVPVFADSNCVLSCSDFMINREGSTTENGQATTTRYNTYRSVTDSCYGVAKDYRVGMSSVMVRVVSARSVWPFPAPKYSIIEDFDMVERLLCVGTLVPLAEPLMVYRWHGNNFSSRLDVEMSEWLDWIEHIEAFDMTLEEQSLIRIHVETRLLSMKCRRARLSGDRIATWRSARLLPFSRIKVKFFFSLILPTGLLRRLISSQ